MQWHSVEKRERVKHQERSSTQRALTKSDFLLRGLHMVFDFIPQDDSNETSTIIDIFFRKVVYHRLWRGRTQLDLRLSDSEARQPPI